MTSEGMTSPTNPALVHLAPNAALRMAAEMRSHSVRTRYAIILIGAAIAALCIPWYWCVFWAVSSLIWQRIDLFVSVRIAAQRLPAHYFLTSSLISAILFGSLTVFLWSMGGEYGRECAALILGISVIHALTYAHHDIRIFAAMCLPYLFYAIAMPAQMMVRHGIEPAGFGVVIGVILLGWRLHGAYAHNQRATHELILARLAADSRRAEAEKANKAKSDFLAMISHELRTPMNAVLGAADLLRRGELHERDQELVEAIASSSGLLMSQLNELLDFAKIEAQKLEITPQPMDLQAVFTEITSIWRSRFAAKGLEFVVDLPANLDFDVQMDRGRLQQIVGNLLSNAHKFTENGRVELQLSSEGSPNGHQIRLAIRDSGIGMPQDRLESIFEPFSQADSSITRRYGGTGLGLAICRRLAGLMGGTLTAHSLVDVGSTFTLILPAPRITRDRENTSGLEKPVPIQQLGRGGTILIAEDHPTNQLILQRFLKLAGHRTIIAGNGVEAVEAASQRGYDLILMDLRMPEMDGFQAISNIREFGPNVDTPIIVLSADARGEDRDRAASIGANDYLTKPIDPARLFAALARWLPPEDDAGCPTLANGQSAA